jgi:hypothetical protein
MYFVVLIISLLLTPVQAKQLTPEQVPEPLQPWTNWVMQSHPDHHCPFLYNNFQQKRCSWPSRLNLDLDDKSGQFSIQWQVYSESWIELPGSSKFWPLNVEVNQKPALVLVKNSKPVIKLTAGSYQIKGVFKWDFIPDNLPIPADTGLITLNVKGKSINYPTIKNSQVWLKESDIGRKKPKSIQNNLDLQVFRKINDDVPLQVTTHLILEVAGDQREIKLAHPLLNDSIPISLSSPLPARLEPDGRLLVQVRPGRWQIELLSRHPQLTNQISLNVSDKNWPEAEIWSFQNQPYQRVVEIEQVTPIDPNQTNLPDAWKNLPAYRVNQGDSMVIKTLRRGDPEPEPNQLHLQRKLWLDFDGGGYTINDHITGKMTHGWRLNTLPGMELGQVTLNGNSQLITQLPDKKSQGIEVRKGAIELTADSRLTQSITDLSTTGWAQHFHQVNAVLNLPPGWRLLAASGVDNVPNSWISRWTLLDLFLVLIAAFSVARIWNVPWGLFALITLAIIWHEVGAPRFIWLNVLAVTALLQVVPVGQFRKILTWYRYASWLALLVLVIPFMVNQVRMGLYPQLEKPWQRMDSQQYGRAEADFEMASAPVAMEEMASQSLSKVRRMAKKVPNKYYQEKAVNFNRIDPDANIQTGPGLPQWKWHSIHLSWNGSVDSQQQVQFWYITPMMSKLLNFTRVILISLLMLLLFGVVTKRFVLEAKLPLLVALVLLPLLSAFPAQNVWAEYPDQAMLDELEKRLLEAPQCLPDCAQISVLDLRISPDKMQLTLHAHAQQAVVIPLPVNDKQWLPNKVKIDGKLAPAMYRSHDGKLWLQLGQGEHTILLTGKIPVHDRFVLPLPLKPHRVNVKNTGWQIEGVYEHGRVGGQLQFSRIRTKTTDKKNKNTLEPGVLPPFIRVERTLQLGLDWRVKSRIIRISPGNAAVVLQVPLLTGESITTPGMRVKNAKLQINMPARESQLSWESVLSKTAQIEFFAPDTEQWTEVWRADVSPIWHLETTGIAVVHHQDKQGRWLPEWRPWPGEKVSIAISRPEAIKGQTLTIDKSEIVMKPGKRIQEGTLKLSLRSSQGSQHTITLPEKAQLQAVTINGVTQPIRQNVQQLTLPVKPGTQKILINWLQGSALGSVFETPQLNIGQASVNSHVQVRLGQDRWVLFTWGPRFGPAVLFWGVLVVIILLAFGLSKIKLTPLKFWQWSLLLIGLSQIPVISALVVVAWLMALRLREKKSSSDADYFNLIQVSIGILTLLSLVILFIAIEQGLLGSPDMQITGNSSSAYTLNWYQDRSAEILPTATVVSVPLTVYRILMLLWSLWLAISLLNWLKWGWHCFNNGGLWKQNEKKKQPPKVEEYQQEKNKV